MVQPQRYHWYRALVGAMAVYGYSPAILTAGCSECAPVWNWPTERIVRFFVAWQLVDASIQIARVVPEITSAFRCPPCNERRDGAPESGHMADMGGEPYAAFDIEFPWRADQMRVLKWVNANGQKNAFGDLLRAWTGLDLHAGVIFYNGSPRIHLDIRDYDWLKIYGGVGSV